MKPYTRIECTRCSGHGQVPSFHEHAYPDECPDCGGAGTIVRYESGAFASWPGGPLLGRETKAEREKAYAN